MIKKFLIILIFFIPLQAFGFEDCIILSDYKIDSAYSKDENIASIETFYTIDNSKETLILKAKKEGKTQIIIETISGSKIIEAYINDERTILSEVDGLTHFPIDMINVQKKPLLRGK